MSIFVSFTISFDKIDFVDVAILKRMSNITSFVSPKPTRTICRISLGRSREMLQFYMDDFYTSLMNFSMTSTLNVEQSRTAIEANRCMGIIFELAVPILTMPL